MVLKSARTLNFDNLVVTQFILQDPQKNLSDEKYIKGKDIRLCGVPGDSSDTSKFMK